MCRVRETQTGAGSHHEHLVLKEKRFTVEMAESLRALSNPPETLTDWSICGSGAGGLAADRWS
jgi:hypothetical protein